ncbi:MAG: DUF4864 domain-containing protein [Propylenella sp.]
MRVLLVLLVSAWLSGAAAAFSDADRAVIQNTIERQLRAFLADDGATAYSFAAPGIKQLFPNEAIFMEMVRRGYQPVYRPRSYSFGELTEEGGQLVQNVDIIDSEGEFWTAVYTLRQFDGAWRITGCYLVKKPGETA